jgi:energy-coupling factor transport system ATP-binding protein
VALASIERLAYAYPGAVRPALEDVSLTVEQGEVVCVLGPSGGGKSTLLRALAGLVPHFHGGSFSGRVEVAGLDTRRHRPAELAGRVATVFQDPEDQVVLTGVAAEVEFGLENVGAPPAEIQRRALAALETVGARALAGRRAQELSGGELQRVCLASALALEPELLLLDEPTSQLDPESVGPILDAACEGRAVVISEQRPGSVLERCDRVLFVDGGRVVLDAPRERALEWLAEHRPLYLHKLQVVTKNDASGSDLAPVVSVDEVTYAYGERHAVGPADLQLRSGEIVALVGPNGSGKTTLAKLAAGLLEPQSGLATIRGRTGYLSQDPGRYLVCERADEEVALGVDGDLARARRRLADVGLAGLEGRHPRDLSSGERERLALAAVLVTEPDVLILDEPTRGVDPERKAELAALLEAGRDRRATLVVTHDQVFAADVADRMIDLLLERELSYA